MNRTIIEIYNEIAAEKAAMAELQGLQPEIDDAQTLLADLTSTSKVAVWRLFAFVVAVAIWTHEKLWDVFKADVDEIVAAAIPGTARWYRNICLLFQYGDSMIYNDYKFQYDPIDVSKQIIKRASATEQGGDVLLKVAKEVNSLPVKLTNDELDAFRSYIAKIKFAGTWCNVISADADLLNVTIQVYYNASLINASGELLTDTSLKPAEDAINNYLASLPWDGIVKTSALVDAVQAATGVSDVVLIQVFAKANEATEYSAINRTYRTVAGYIVANSINITYTSV